MPTFYNSTAMTKNEIMASREDRYDGYAKGGRVRAKEGRWIQKVNKSIKARGTKDSFLKEELPTIRFAFSSFVASKNIDKGEVFSMKNLITKRINKLMI